MDLLVCSTEWKKIIRKVTKLVDVQASNLCGHFKDGIIKAYDEVCEKKRGMRSNGDT